MSTWRILVSLLLLIFPALNQGVKTSCEIPSVEIGDDATLTTHFDADLTNAKRSFFSVLHMSDNATDSKKMLSCLFTNGNVECDKTTCCTWERKVADVFRVYIHNVSRELAGRFWGFLSPSNVEDQKSCNFNLKASTCTDINASNSYVMCSNRPITIGQACTVICKTGHYYQENQTMTYTCVGKNKWSPTISDIACEAPMCSTDSINTTNSYVICSSLPVYIGHICNVTCNSGYITPSTQTWMEYYCVGENKWFPANPVTFCYEQRKVGKLQALYFIFLLLIVIPIAIIAIIILFKQRYVLKVRKKKRRQNKEDILLPLKSSELQVPVWPMEDYWQECVRIWYPDLHSQTYFLPPIHFNRVSFTVNIIAGRQVLVPLIPEDFDVLGNRALQRVLQCLRILADNCQQKEVMMVISQLKFGKYLGEPSFAAAVALLPRPSTLPAQYRQQHYDKGCFDVLIIHKEIGLLTLEIKSVGGNFDKLEMTEEAQDELVMKEVKKAVKQLDKTEVVLKHLTSDITDIISVTKILALPNITSNQLLRAISRDPFHGQVLCQCLGVQSADDAVKLCLLSDQLSDKQTFLDEDHSLVQALKEWWQNAVRARRPQCLKILSFYEQLVARFCGPATTVEVHCVSAPSLNIRTLGEAVSETGERVVRLVLLPQQMDILNQSPPRAFLSGPPGTGKTIVLIMQGLTWIQRGYDVHVVSTWDRSRAATIVIEYQLQETAKTPTARSRVHRHEFDFMKDEKVENAVICLTTPCKGRQLCVIADEVGRFRESSAHHFSEASAFTKFCVQLINNVSCVYIWGASVNHDARPSCLEEFRLTTPLRSPPVIVREVMKSAEIKNKESYDYTVSDFPVPTDGPPVMRIKHCDGQSGHTRKWPLECVKCGYEVARVLKLLNVGKSGDNIGPPPLQYRDVLVLCVEYPTDGQVKTYGGMISMASGLVRGLRDCHVPVRVVKEGDEAAIRDLALGVGDLVRVAHWNDVHGLERKVVVVESLVDCLDRFYTVSRCTSQLVVIDH